MHFHAKHTFNGHFSHRCRYIKGNQITVKIEELKAKQEEEKAKQEKEKTNQVMNDPVVKRIQQFEKLFTTMKEDGVYNDTIPNLCIALSQEFPERNTTLPTRRRSMSSIGHDFHSRHLEDSGVGNLKG